MPEEYFESAHFKLPALTGKNPIHDIGTGFQKLAEKLDEVLYGKVSRCEKPTGTSSIAEGSPQEASSQYITVVVATFVGTTGDAFYAGAYVAGVKVGSAAVTAKGAEGEPARIPCTFPVGPGEKWEWKKESGSGVSCLASYTRLLTS